MGAAESTLVPQAKVLARVARLQRVACIGCRDATFVEHVGLSVATRPSCGKSLTAWLVGKNMAVSALTRVLILVRVMLCLFDTYTRQRTNSFILTKLRGTNGACGRAVNPSLTSCKKSEMCVPAKTFLARLKNAISVTEKQSPEQQVKN